MEAADGCRQDKYGATVAVAETQKSDLGGDQGGHGRGQSVSNCPAPKDAESVVHHHY